MSKHLVNALLSVALVVSFVSRASAQGPVAGPLAISVQSFNSSVTPGEAGQVGFAIENHSTRLSIEVAVRMTITYSNGTQQTVIPDNPGVLGPDEGFVQFIFFPVPADAPSGTATVKGSAVITQVTGGMPKGLERPLRAVDQDTFEVAAAVSAETDNEGSEAMHRTPTCADRHSAPERVALVLVDLL